MNGKITDNSSPLSLGWFSTGNGAGSYGMLKTALDAIDSGASTTQIKFVVCTRDEGEADGSDKFIELAREKEIPVIARSWRKFQAKFPGLTKNKVRREYEKELISHIGEHVEWAIMAGYMLVSATLHNHFRMLNLHPAAPGGPTGTWRQVVAHLIKNKTKRSGITVHKVTDDLDAGEPMYSHEYDTHTPATKPLWRDETKKLELTKALRDQIVANEREALKQALINLPDYHKTALQSNLK